MTHAENVLGRITQTDKHIVTKKVKQKCIFLYHNIFSDLPAVRVN